jgi:hypothetical protein
MPIGQLNFFVSFHLKQWRFIKNNQKAAVVAVVV